MDLSDDRDQKEEEINFRQKGVQDANMGDESVG